MPRTRAQRRRAWMHYASAGFAWHPDASSYLQRSGGLSNGQAGLINDLAIGLSQDLGTSSLANRMDAFWPLANETNLASRQNLVKAAFALTANGTITFTAKQGWAGDGSTGYLGTGVNPATNVVRFGLNAGAIGLAVGTNRTSSDLFCNFGCAVSGVECDIYASISNTTVIRINEQTDVGPAAATARGIWIGNRTGATAKQLDRNGIEIATSANAVDSLPNAEIIIGALNNGGTPVFHTTDQHRVAFIMGPLTVAERPKIAARIEKYLDGMNAGVI